MQNNNSHLKNYRILIADDDQQLGFVLKNMLSVMGFTGVEMTRSGQKALSLLSQNKYDFLITEWQVKDVDGIGLISQIRRGEMSNDPTLPILMLTGRAEMTDIATARDVGINEYVVKPFTAQSVFMRLQRLIENPREFVVSEGFVGPDRRRRGNPPAGVAERRAPRPLQAQPFIRPTSGLHIPARPKLWTPDYSLKQKLPAGVSLQSLITPAILELSQASIDSIGNESLLWVKENMDELRDLHATLVSGTYKPDVSNRLREVALTVNSRAGTFGLKSASEVAYMLYLFCRNQLQPGEEKHHLIVGKHLDVLQVILGEHLRGQNSEASDSIVKALQMLVEKYTA